MCGLGGACAGIDEEEGTRRLRGDAGVPVWRGARFFFFAGGITGALVRVPARISGPDRRGTSRADFRVRAGKVQQHSSAMVMPPANEQHAAFATQRRRHGVRLVDARPARRGRGSGPGAECVGCVE